jgi:hypothetical protein
VLVTDLDTQLILDLDGPASVQSFGSTVDLNTASVPEPSAILWQTPLMLALLWVGKRRLGA